MLVNLDYFMYPRVKIICDPIAKIWGSFIVNWKPGNFYKNEKIENKSRK